MYRPIEDYGVIGNLRSAVLVSKDGSIDWAAAPFIDSPSVFAALLDEKKGGFWQIAPTSTFTASQHYTEDTNVLETRFTTDSGVALVTDYLPLEKEKTFVPAEEDVTFRIKRRVRCERGRCMLRVEFFPRFDYARGDTVLSHAHGGVLARNGSMRGVLASRSPMPIQGDRVIADIALSEGESRFFIFRYNIEQIPPRDIHEEDEAYHEWELGETKRAWHSWVNDCDLDVCPALTGPWEDAVKRSLLVLKILFFEPVGTVAAAATTSLPEEIGGIRNWDYRYTWLRDSSFIFDAFFRFGHTKEARLYLEWILEECKRRGSPEHIKIMYPLYGERVLTEEVLAHLDGYRGSRPVRIGNAAQGQRQWDIYGSILNVAWELHRLQGGRPIGPHDWDLLREIADHVARIWREPDEGLWEVRGGKDHFLYSKVMCYVGLDRAIRLSEAYGYAGETEWWLQERNAIKDQVLERGWNEKIQSFTHSFDSEYLDATALLFPRVGFIDGDHPKMLATIHAIRERLRCGEDGLLFRHSFPDGLPGTPGADLFASFWLVDALVFAKKTEEARKLFERLLARANHVGLYAEELDKESGRFLGNFPQAYTHVGVLNSAHRLTEALQKEGKL